MQLNRRSLLAAAGALVALVVIIVIIAMSGGDGGDGDTADEGTTTTTSTSSTTTTTTTTPVGPVAPFTGLPVDDEAVLEQPAFVVKISNNDARSLEALIGLEEADVVVEERIEDRATRFAAIFHSRLPEVVGPIRSGRTSDLEILTNLGDPILVYSGANPSVTGQLRSLERDDMVKLVVDDGTGTNLFRDNDFRRPDNLFADLTLMLERFGEEGGAGKAIFSYRGPSDDSARSGDDGNGLTVTGRDIVAFVWDEEEGYVRVQDGVIHATRTGEPLVVDNVVAMETAYLPSTINPGSVDAQIVGSGGVNVFVGGVRISGTWERETRADPYRLVDEDGEPILLDPGTTWLTLLPAGTYQFEVSPEIAALVSGDAG